MHRRHIPIEHIETGTPQSAGTPTRLNKVSWECIFGSPFPFICCFCVFMLFGISVVHRSLSNSCHNGCGVSWTENSVWCDFYTIPLNVWREVSEAYALYCELKRDEYILVHVRGNNSWVGKRNKSETVIVSEFQVQKNDRNSYIFTFGIKMFRFVFTHLLIPIRKSYQIEIWVEQQLPEQKKKTKNSCISRKSIVSIDIIYMHGYFWLEQHHQQLHVIILIFTTYSKCFFIVKHWVGIVNILHIRIFNLNNANVRHDNTY